VDHYTIIMAVGTLTDADLERAHVAGQPVEIRLASLTTPEQVEMETADADGILVTLNPLPKEIINSFGSKVRIIGRAGLGLDTIDLGAARARGIAVYHTPDYATNEVATHAVAMILATNRHLVEANTVARTEWREWRRLTPLVALHEQVIGVVGIGRIGRAVIQRVIPLAHEVVVFDPYVDTPIEGTTAVSSLDELLERCDVVTLHVPATAETETLIGPRQLAIMKRGSVLINVSRGKLVDESALATALHAGTIGAAGLDVLAEEPPSRDAPILSAPNVLLSPHFAWYSVIAERRMRTMAIDGIIDYLEGRPQRAGRLAVSPNTAE
jgi:D-3-phosphoglycerate dehydrogenase